MKLLKIAKSIAIFSAIVVVTLFGLPSAHHKAALAQNYSVSLDGSKLAKKSAMSINLTDNKLNREYSIEFGVEKPGKITSEVEIIVDHQHIYVREQTKERHEDIADGYSRDQVFECGMAIFKAVEFSQNAKDFKFVSDACPAKVAKP